jgi:DNA topoisomerase-1
VPNSIAGNEKEASKVVVVESPAKARKIQEYLGDQYMVLASYGHIRDLPPKAGSVLPEKNFEMIWKPLKNSDVHLKELEKAISHATSVLLATDPDREGEAISWHLVQELRQRGAIRPETQLSRISFTSVTKDAISKAMLSPREIDQQLVDAYLARRALDYLFGFNLSPILWRKLPGATSAGRVQSVALRLVCEREKEIEQFEAMAYWTVESTLQLPDGTFVKCDVVSVDGERVPSPGYESESLCHNVENKIRSSDFIVHQITNRKSARKPLAPFTTSTLQQDATRKLGLSSTRVMQLAQQLYEGGIITYMRTDSPSLGQDVIHDIRKVIETCHGQEYLPPSARIYKSRVKNAQEAHEAIRPTNVTLQPQALGVKGYDSKAIHLYSIILNRAVSSQAQDAVVDSVKVQFKSPSGDIILQSTGSHTSFEGYLKILNDSSTDDADENSSEDSSQYHCLRSLSEGEAAKVTSSKSIEHFTKAPARFTEGSLVKKMEEIGVGRPSTYAPTLKLLQGRGYIRLVKKRLYAEPIGRILTAFLQKYLPKYVDYSFTSDMEMEFDSISQGEQEWTAVLQSFWADFKIDTSALADLSGTAVIDTLNKELEYFLFRHSINVIDGSPEGGHCCPLCKSPLSVKLSHKGGPFIGCSNYPSCTYTSSLPNPEEVHEPTSPDSIGEAFKSLSVAEKYGMRGKSVACQLNIFYILRITSIYFIYV